MKVFFILICLLTVGTCLAQDKFDINTILEFQQKMNRHFADTTESPLTKPDLATFKQLDFYTPNEKFFVCAKLVRTPNEKPFEMQTTTARLPKYVKYGILHFKIVLFSH